MSPPRGLRRQLAPLLLMPLLLAGARPGPLVWAEPAPPTTLHPLHPMTPTDRRVQALVHDRLFHWSPTEGGWSSRVVAALAPTEEGALRVTLRPRIRWHDGARLTARDVCYTVDVLRDPRTTGPLALRMRQLLARCAVDPSDPLSAEIALKRRPTPEPRALLDIPLLPAHVAPDQPHDVRHPLARHPVGTGPFQARPLGATWRFVRHRAPHHAPPFRALELRVIPDPQDAVQAVRTGAIHGLAEVPPSALPALRQGDGIRLHHNPTGRWWSLALDTRRGPLADPAIREALDLLLDREALQDEALGPTRADPAGATGPFPPRSRSSNRALPPPRQDPQRARDLLHAAGATFDGDRWSLHGAPLTLRVGAPASLPAAQAVLEHLTRSWSGLQVQPVLLQPDAYHSALAGESAEDLDALWTGWQSHHDPATHTLSLPADLDALYHTRTAWAGALNPFDHSDPELDRLLARARAAPPDLRPLIHQEIHGRLAETRPHLFLGWTDDWSAWSDALTPVLLSPIHGFTELDRWGVRRSP